MRDDEYWDDFYEHTHPDLLRPSTFAQYCLPRLRAGSVLFELGCGNGRDAQYFAANRLRVIACDRSAVAIRKLAQRVAQRQFEIPPELRVADMAALGDDVAGQIHTVYSRFTLHAVTAQEASAALAWAFRSLAPGGCLMAEARSVEGSLYGKGVEVARDTFLHDGHRRRFLRRDELEAELVELGFSIVEMIESDGLAVHGDDDPVVIRVIAARP